MAVLYVLWALLNVALSLYFLFLCFRAVKLVRERLGVLAAILFTIGLLSFAGQPDADTQKLGEEFKFSFSANHPDSIANTNFAVVKLDNNVLFSTRLTVTYTETGDSAFVIPVRGSSYVNGLLAGIHWHAQAATATAFGTTIHYTVYGTIDWKLFGLTVFKQAKSYTGAIDTRKNTH